MKNLLDQTKQQIREFIESGRTKPAPNNLHQKYLVDTITEALRSNQKVQIAYQEKVISGKVLRYDKGNQRIFVSQDITKLTVIVPLANINKIKIKQIP
ncbi:hypothetical protein [Streptococcus dentiloxodontae]